MRLKGIVFALALLAPAPALAGSMPVDELNSPMWEAHAERLFSGAPVVFDHRVKVLLPLLVENQHALPVTVDARELGAVEKIVIFADYNPIPIALELEPLKARAYIATRIKIDQGTPVRAAVRTKDGTWRIGGAWVDASGGGCSAPPSSRVRGDWTTLFGQMRGAAWQDAGGTRMRVSIRHPMDTGLVENIAAYNLEELVVADASGIPLARLKIHGSVSEDPSFTLMVDPAGDGALAIRARDTDGVQFVGTIETGDQAPNLAMR
ncbi:MAG: quinoprotein dehydrogenase-associated SoxYZ-like carrier [Erythrobacter sp.]|jgi:sulfur-oxidizing protein SoxY|nr:quinoprotein dehydrogenase-associated SoxYZ-like carrier [Erythrobacter sp.]